MDAFELLSIPKRLVIGDNELAQVVKQLSRKTHPDSGGDAGDFEKVREAGDCLKSPLKRLRLAISLSGGEVGTRGAVDEEVMDYFSTVALVLEKVDGLLSDRRQVKSELGKALINARVPKVKREVDQVIGCLEALETRMLERFEQFDQEGWKNSLGEMEDTCRGMSFVSKWKQQLQEATGKLFEVLLGG